MVHITFSPKDIEEFVKLFETNTTDIISEFLSSKRALPLEEERIVLILKCLMKRSLFDIQPNMPFLFDVVIFIDDYKSGIIAIDHVSDEYLMKIATLVDKFPQLVKSNLSLNKYQKLNSKILSL